MALYHTYSFANLFTLDYMSVRVVNCGALKGTSTILYILRKMRTGLWTSFAILYVSVWARRTYVYNAGQKHSFVWGYFLGPGWCCCDRLVSAPSVKNWVFNDFFFFYKVPIIGTEYLVPLEVHLYFWHVLWLRATKALSGSQDLPRPTGWGRAQEERRGAP